ncbi:MAG: hypothetical protein ACYTAN_04620 [Planctomycetota bacterium]|jgi:hypothetical protein
MKMRKSESGVALLVTIITLVALIGLTLGLFYTALADNKEARINQAMITALSVAEGGTEQAQKELMEAAVNELPLPTEGTFTVNGMTANYTIAPVGDVIIGSPIDGAMSVDQLYQITADASWNGLHKQVQKLVCIREIPLFQFAIFYGNDLEIMPGPNLTLNGRVHSNGDMYVGTESTLNFDTDYVRSIGHMYRQSYMDKAPTEGIVNCKVFGDIRTEKWVSQKGFKPVSTSGFDSLFLGLDKNGDGDFDDMGDYENWALGALSLWQGTVKSADHGAQEIKPVDRSAIQAYTPQAGGDYILNKKGEYVAVAPGAGDYGKGYYHERADVVLIDGKIFQDGTEVTVWPDLDGDGAADSPLSESTFYDMHEEKFVTVTDIDIGVLGASGVWPENGLLYAVRSDATVDQPNGFRLTNAVQLADRLTMVTEDPVYTHGHVNMGGKEYPKQPMAVLSDSFNILSNSFDDALMPLEQNHANPTQLNLAIMTGAPPKPDGGYNPRFEYLLRYHEKWTGSPAEIRGSFVHVWESQIARGTANYENEKYTALSRDWDYDVAFEDPSYMPPFTPKITYLRRVVWVSR